MKNLVLILFVICFTFLGGNHTAIAANVDYSAEISALRHVKSAKIKPINNQIKVIKEKIEKTILNTDISEEERNKRLETYQNQILDLEMKKAKIKKEYKSDKKSIKSKYKWGGMI